MKKVMFYVSLIMMVIVVLSATLLQTIPFVIGTILMYAVVCEKRKGLTTWLLVLSVLMALLNLAAVSIPDVLFWGVVAIVFLPRNK